MRRLPTYFLIDVSDSMIGEPIRAVQSGIDMVISQLRQDPYALETVYIAVLAFAGKAEILAPLEELIAFNPPVLPIGSGTNLGAGLDLLMDCIEREVQKTTPEKKGDWKPIIFLFTDGAPTDNPEKAISRWNRDFRKRANMVAVTFGNGADVPLLEKLTDAVLNLAETTPADFREFFQWISASLQASSVAVSEFGKDGIELAKGGINLKKAESSGSIDENFAILPVRCIQSGKLWLAKFAHNREGTPQWLLDGAHIIDEDAYKRLGGCAGSSGQIDLADTDYIPECPVCKKSSGLVHCDVCDNLSCSPQKGSGECPWCHARFSGIRNVDSLNVNRARG